MSKKGKKRNSGSDSIPLASDLEEKLQRATKNLYYISETDAEILPFIGQSATEVNRSEVLRQIGKSAAEKIEERDFDQFFGRLTKIHDWYGEEEIGTAKKYEALKDLLVKNLKNLKVFKVGEIELSIFFVGLDHSGRLCGVKTTAVET